MLISKSSGMHPVTVRGVSDQGEVELSLRLPIGGIPRYDRRNGHNNDENDRGEDC